MKESKKDAPANSLAKEDFWVKEFNLDSKNERDKSWDNSVYANKKLQSLLEKYLPKGKNYKILEIGCYPGFKLVFFRKKFGYSIYGVEFLEKACSITKENLKRSHVNGNVICSDFFDKSFLKKYDSKFDIIFDFGFCEHFKDFNKTLKNYSGLLKKNGYVAIMMPNMQGVYKFLASKELLKIHNLDIMDLKVIEEDAGKYFKKLFCGYAGKIYADSSKESNINFLIKNKTLKKIFIFMFTSLNKIMGYLPIPESKPFSPYIVYIGQKK